MDGAGAFGSYWPAYLGVLLAGGLLGFAACRIARVTLFLRTHGTIARTTGPLAARLADLVSSDLISEQELLSRVDPDLLTEQVRGALAHAAEELTVELLLEHKPELWELLPEGGKRKIVDDISESAPRMARRTVAQLQVDATDVLDLCSLVHRALTAEPTRLVRFFELTTRRALRSVERYGTALGLLVGAVAAVLVGFTAHPLLLVIAGVIVGGLAYQTGLRMVFGAGSMVPDAENKQPPQALAALRGALATDAGAFFASEVITFDSIVTELLHGPRSERLRGMIRRDVQHAADARLSIAKPVVTIAVGSQNLRAIRNAAAERSLLRLPDTLRGAERYLTRAIDVRATIGHRIRRMPPERLRAMLLPSLVNRAWQLILPATLLGGAAGAVGWAVW